MQQTLDPTAASVAELRLRVFSQQLRAGTATLQHEREEAPRPSGPGVTRGARRVHYSRAGGSAHTRLYFAYGSNMATAHTVAHCPSAVAVGTALLPNFAIGFRRNSTGPQFVGGISTAEPAAGKRVVGVLFSVAVAELEAWDADYRDDRYYRSSVYVLPLSLPAVGTAPGAAVPAGDTSESPLLSAEVYLPDPLEGPFPPAANYVALMAAGAREHGLHDHAAHLETLAAHAAAASTSAGDAGSVNHRSSSGGGSDSADSDVLAVNIPAVVAELRDTFERYEAALDANDVGALDSFFWRSPFTTRLANSQHGYGFDAIQRHRAATRAASASGSSKGERVRVVVTTLGTRFGTVMYEYKVRGSPDRTGRQSQTFVKFPPVAETAGSSGLNAAGTGWKCVAAHVSSVETCLIVR